MVWIFLNLFLAYSQFHIIHPFCHGMRFRVELTVEGKMELKCKLLSLVISEDHEFRLGVKNELGLVAETNLVHVITHFENNGMLRFEIFCH